MMDKLRNHGAELVQRQVKERKSQIKSLLQLELPEDAIVSETADGIEVQARQMGQEIIGNSSLRDVAFLMRGVR